MSRLKRFILRHPVLSLVVMCYTITWSVWFSIPLIAGSDWTLIKLFIGIGMGPGIAAIVLDRVRGTAGPIGTRKWWIAFAFVFLLIAAINISSLITGDTNRTVDFAAVVPSGISAIGITGSLLTAAVCGFVFACAVTSRSRTLSSILNWRVPVRWWLIVLFFIAALDFLGYGIMLAFGRELRPWPGADLPGASWALFVLRSTLFTLLVVAVGEEIGWRGWMLPELQKRYSPLRSSIILGLVWGFWHFPLFFNGAFSGTPDGIIEYIFLGPFKAILYTWIYNRTRGNLLLVMVLHTASNNTGRILPVSPPSFVPFLLIPIILVFTERMWRRRPDGAK